MRLRALQVKIASALDSYHSQAVAFAPDSWFLGKAGVSGKLLKARCAVPLVSCNSSQISRQERPRARRAAILLASTITRGLPRCLPLARAFRRPARTRSAVHAAVKIVTMTLAG